MSDSDFDLDQLKDVDLTQLGGEEGDGDDVFRTGGGACDEVANSFSKISVTNWVKSGHQWEASAPSNPFQLTQEYLRDWGDRRQQEHSRQMHQETSGPLVVGGSRDSRARASFSSLGSAAGGAVQSPPGFDDQAGAGAPPPPGFYPMTTTVSSATGMVASSSGVPQFSAPSTTPKHFKFPSGGGANGQVSLQQQQNTQSLAARGLLPSQRLGLTPSPLPFGSTRGGGLRPHRPQYNFCVFCKNNGEDEKFYMTHTLKDDNGLIRCPVLMNYVCPICGASGKVAHTIRYCPKNKDDRYHDNFAPITLLKGMRSSTGKTRMADNVESWMEPPTSVQRGGFGAQGSGGSGYRPQPQMLPAANDQHFRPVLGQGPLQTSAMSTFHHTTGLGPQPSAHHTTIRSFMNTPPPGHYRYQ